MPVQSCEDQPNHFNSVHSSACRCKDVVSFSPWLIPPSLSVTPIPASCSCFDGTKWRCRVECWMDPLTLQKVSMGTGRGAHSCLSVLQLLTRDLTTFTLFPHLRQEEMMKKFALFSGSVERKKSKWAALKLAVMSSNETGETLACHHHKNLRPGTFLCINRSTASWWMGGV